MIKKIFFKSFLALAIGLFALSFKSCNYLDIDEYINDMQSLDTVFSKKETTLQYLYHVYSFLKNPGSTWRNGGSPWVLVSDEAFGTQYDNETDSYNQFANNIYNSSYTYYDNWNSYYQGIRTASVFLNRVNDCPELRPVELAEVIGEAQFLRAYFYFELMKQYGPVCIVPENGFQLDQPMSEILVSRNSWDECVDFVAAELKKAATNLPAKRPSTDFGKPTSGAAYAVLSRLLLYNASPLFNGNTSYADFVNTKTGVPYINQEYQEEKWAQAAVAAKKVIDNTNYALYALEAADDVLPVGVTSDPDYYLPYPDGAGGIDHYKSYADLFNGTLSSTNNKELIFGMPGVGVDRYMAPLLMRGRSVFNIPQKLVDAYYMADGRTINDSSEKYPYREDMSEKDTTFSEYILPGRTYGWYLNREMRFYVTVGFAGSFYKGSSSTYAEYRNFRAEFWSGGNNDKSNNIFLGDQAHSYCMTGYLCRKFIHPEDCFSASYGQVKKKIWMEYRLAEIYLNYVEALNELTKSYTIDGVSVSRDVHEIRKYFNLIRHRAGLPGITEAEAANAETVKELLQRERQIELAWEGHRYFDTRRWKTAPVEENGPVLGMSVNKTEENYYRITAVKEVSYAYKEWGRRKNFWPLPLDEVTKNTNLDQNPGW